MEKIKPTKYEASKVFIKKMLRPEIIEKLTKVLGNFDVPIIVIFAFEDKKIIPINISHTSRENTEQGIIELEYKDPQKAEEILKILTSIKEG